MSCLPGLRRLGAGLLSLSLLLRSAEAPAQSPAPPPPPPAAADKAPAVGSPGVGDSAPPPEGDSAPPAAADQAEPPAPPAGAGEPGPRAPAAGAEPAAPPVAPPPTAAVGPPDGGAAAGLGRPAGAEPPVAEPPDGPSSAGAARYPGYIVGGIVALAAGAAHAVGGGFAAVDGSPRWALGLTAVAAISSSVGVPLILLGATPEVPENSELAAAGVALATPGMIALGLGGTILVTRIAERSDDELVSPLVIMAGGGAALVTGVVLWAAGAGPADEPAQARLTVGPTSVSLSGSW